MATREDEAITAYYQHSSARRVHTCTLMADVLRKQYPDLDLVITQESNCDLFGFARSSGNASCMPIEHGDDRDTLALTAYVTDRQRTEPGHLKEKTLLGRYQYEYEGQRFIMYLVDGRDGPNTYPKERFFFVLHPEKIAIQALVMDVGRWTSELHDEIWIFDSGFWQKSADLFDSIRNATWANVILDESMKKVIVEEHLSFFRSRDVFRRLHIPWKRGLLYYGPPGNGKTISIKATMNLLYNLRDPIPTLYVRTLTSYAGPEMSISMIFEKARSMAPCYLVFEDLDTIVTDNVKSYFFNEVDGLKANEGIFMIGTTNHLDRLDPGISERPSRFDRKYLFPNPDEDQRVAYCHFWQKKLESNKSVEFPDILCRKIAEITDLFSFAYLQEAFVATLLVLAKGAELVEGGEDGDSWTFVNVTADTTDGGNGTDDELDRFPLWKEMKKQVKILRQNLAGDAGNGSGIENLQQSSRHSSAPRGNTVNDRR